MSDPTTDAGLAPAGSAHWVDVGSVADVTKARRTVVDPPGDVDPSSVDPSSSDAPHPILVVAHEGSFYALDNICIHKDRELSKGVILKGRLVCPGHQWAFDLACGWEAVKAQCQPTYPVRVRDDRVEVDVAGRTTVDAPPADA